MMIALRSGNETEGEGGGGEEERRGGGQVEDR